MAMKNPVALFALVVVVGLLFVVGCGGKGKTDLIKDVEVTGGDVEDKDAHITKDNGKEEGTSEVEGEVEDAETVGETTGEVGETADGDAGGSCEPTPCKTHADCEGIGLCVQVTPGSGTYVCAPYCQEECPADWECKSVAVDGPDPVSLCLPPVETRCQGCSKDSECLFPGALCIKGSGTVGYCGRLCDPDEDDCPDGFVCDMAKDKNGKPLGNQCMATPGTCCVAGKLKSCDDKNPCTLDFCDASLGCKHSNLDGPCEGENEPCHEYKCVNGACVCFKVPLDITMDGSDDDRYGLVDEYWEYGRKLP